MGSDHRYDLEDSPSFKGMVTMYRLYTVDVECEGLPETSFSSVVSQRGSMMLFGWSWITWEQSIDVLHARAQMRDCPRILWTAWSVSRSFHAPRLCSPRGSGPLASR